MFVYGICMCACMSVLCGCVYKCLCVVCMQYIYICVCMCTLMAVCVPWQKWTLLVFLCHFNAAYFETVSFWAQRCSFWLLDWQMGSWDLWVSILTLGFQIQQASVSWLLYCFVSGDLNSGPFACRPNILSNTTISPTTLPLFLTSKKQRD